MTGCKSGFEARSGRDRLLSMIKDDIIARLKDREEDLRRLGVLHVALFGSRARGDDHAKSDTDLLVELDPSADISIFDYAGLKRYIGNLVEGPVDVVDRAALKQGLQRITEAEAIYAF